MVAHISDQNPDEVLDTITTAIREQQVPECPDVLVPWPTRDHDLTQKSAKKESVGRRRFQFAAAAAIIAAFSGFVAIPWLDSESRVMAQVQQAIEKTKTVSFRMQTLEAEKEISSFRFRYVSPDLVRAENEQEVHVLNGDLAKTMDVDHSKRLVQIRPIYEIEAMRRHVLGSFASLMEVSKSKVVSTREREYDGQTVLELKLMLDGSDAKALVNKKTMLPVRVELDRGKNADDIVIREVLTDFQFYDSIDEKSFAITAPDGYVINEMKPQPIGKQHQGYLVKPREGLGPAEFGMKKDEIIALVGKPDRIESRPGMKVKRKVKVPVLTPKNRNIELEEAGYTLNTLIYDSRGFRITVSSQDGMQSFKCFDQHTMGPASRRFLGKTTSGIKIGSDWAKVIDVFGQPQTKLDGTAAFYSKPAMHFDFRGGKLYAFSISKRK